MKWNVNAPETSGLRAKIIDQGTVMDSSNTAPTDTISPSTTAGGAADMMMPVTVTHLVLIGIAIVLTVLMLWWGQREWRKRRDGRNDLVARGDTTEVGAAASPPPAATPAPQAAAPVAVPRPIAEPTPAGDPTPIPVAPAPPPLAETLPATPDLATAAGPAPLALTTLKGLGPKAAAMLTDRGVPDVAALAALSPGEAAALDADLGTFSGRLVRDRWHEQAVLLVNGDRSRYETIFGKLGAN